MAEYTGALAHAIEGVLTLCRVVPSEELAKDLNKTVILVQYHAPVKALIGRVMSEA